ncbi:MAG: LPS-assembly protein LptD [Treponema sp.]|nr:LPS-assembly protein LptD [Treponema sp.]
MVVFYWIRHHTSAFICGALYLCVATCLFAQDAVQTVITIENAHATTYQKDEETKDDVILFEGAVRISVEKGTQKSIISADTVTYNRKTQMLYANGSVKLEQTEAGNEGVQTVTASTLLLNTATLEGFFDDGRVVQTQSDAITVPSGSTLVVISDLFGRGRSNTITFKNASLTFCDDPDPHWRIKASRIWLLPGGEFAFLNALLYVGSVPVMWLPAFYYPKDELIFNPVFGYRQREGYFIQTTTYLIGRKPLENRTASTANADDRLSSLFNFMRPTELKEQRREGLVLHNLDSTYTGSTTDFLKLTADWYSNLGPAIGLAGGYHPQNGVGSVDGTMMLGFSNTVFRNGTVYIPRAPSSGTVRRDTSTFFGVQLPFRYATHFAATLNRPFSLSVSLPLYSDPYFTDDFTDRTESMNWISFLTASAGQQEETTDSAAEVSSFVWTLSSSYTVPLPSIVKPYISTLSFTFNASVNFSSRLNSTLPDTDGVKNYSPERKFYYPSQITPATITLALNGTLYEYPSPPVQRTVVTPQFAVPLVVPDELQKPPATTGMETEEPATSATAVSADVAELPLDPVLPKDALPELFWRLPAETAVKPFTYRLSYTFRPTVTTQIAYAAEPLSQPKDFTLKNVRSSMYVAQLPIELSSALTAGGELFTAHNSIRFNPIFQGHPYIARTTSGGSDGGYTDAQITSIRNADRRASTRDLINSNTVSVRPLVSVPMLKNSSIVWRSTVKLVRVQFSESDGEVARRFLFADWTDSDAITEHALDYTIALTQGTNSQFGQSFTLTAKLPPQTDEYNGSLTLTFPYVKLVLSTGIIKKTGSPGAWQQKPLRESLTFSIFKTHPLSLTQSYSYNLDGKYHEQFSVALTWYGLRAAYTMSYGKGYDFNSMTGWVSRSTEAFLPYALSFSYTSPQHNFSLWGGKITIAPGLTTSITADLLRPTNSTFLFTPSLSFKINDMLTLTFSSTSQNSVLYRYFQNALGASGRIPGEENMFIDLINSFRFDNEQLRKNSGFKLKSLNLTLTHDLHDWDFNLHFRLEPRLVTEAGIQRYDFSPYLSLSVVWRPMESMKTEIRDNYGTWQLNP